MRSVRVEFEAGSDLFEVYWNFLHAGGVVTRAGDLVEGEPLELMIHIRSLKKAWRFLAKVARVTEGRAFLAFAPGQEQDTLINAAWADTYLVPQRKHRRLPTRVPVHYALGAGGVASREALLVNLSRGGACLEIEERITVGARVQIVLPRLAEGGLRTPVGAVRWAKPSPSREVGIEFAEALPSTVALAEVEAIAVAPAAASATGS